MAKRRKRVSRESKINASRITVRNEKAKIEHALATQTSVDDLKKLFESVRGRRTNKKLKIELLAVILDRTLPPTAPEDREFVDLRKVWIEGMSRLLSYLSSYQQRQLANHGYCGAMREQVNSMRKIGTKKYKDLIKIKHPELSAEYFIFNYYSHALNPKQRAKIRHLLEKDGCTTPKHEYEKIFSR